MVHGKDTITFRLKDCCSHFGLTFNRKFKNYSIGINIKDKLFSRLKAVEEKCKEFIDCPLSKSLLRSLIQKDDYKTLYLKLKSDQFDEEMVDVKSVVVFGLVTVTAIYKGHEHPSLLIRVDEIDIKKMLRREKNRQ